MFAPGASLAKRKIRSMPVRVNTAVSTAGARYPPQCSRANAEDVESFRPQVPLDDWQEPVGANIGNLIECLAEWQKHAVKPNRVVHGCGLSDCGQKDRVECRQLLNAVRRNHRARSSNSSRRTTGRFPRAAPSPRPAGRTPCEPCTSAQDRKPDSPPVVTAPYDVVVIFNEPYHWQVVEGFDSRLCRDAAFERL